MADGLHMIDAHSHLAAPVFDRDRKEVIRRAREAGVAAAICMGEDYEDNLRVLEAAAADPFILPALGHHPWNVGTASRDVPGTLKLIEENRERIVAIGEVGLDYRSAGSEAERADQRAVFEEFIKAGRLLNLPLSVHVRSAGHYVVDLLAEKGFSRAVLHAFDGKTGHALRGAGEGYVFSIPATVMVSRQKQKLVRALPLGTILLESDSPALAPERGVRNEPAVMAESLKVIAALKKETVNNVVEAAWANTVRAFGLDAAGGVPTPAAPSPGSD